MGLHDTMTAARGHENRLETAQRDRADSRWTKRAPTAEAVEAAEAAEAAYHAKREAEAAEADRKRLEAFMAQGESVLMAEFAVAFLFDEEIGKEVALSADEVRKVCPQGRIINGRFYPHHDTPQAYAGRVRRT
jgi:hypothetical protein